MLGIVETDYFGLMYHSGRKRDELWLNLRNLVCQEVKSSQPYQLELRVKFFVPAHMIQQDVTRYYLSFLLIGAKIHYRLFKFQTITKPISFMFSLTGEHFSMYTSKLFLQLCDCHSFINRLLCKTFISLPFHFHFMVESYYCLITDRME